MLPLTFFSLFTFVYLFCAKPLYSHHTATLLFPPPFSLSFYSISFYGKGHAAVNLSFIISGFISIFSFYHSLSFFFFLFHLHRFLLHRIRLLMYHFFFLVLSFMMIFFFPLPYTFIVRTFVVHAVHLL